jgi:hypothetical protein
MSSKTVARGYGQKHRRLRRSYERSIAAGKVRCARCQKLIVPGEPWDLGHTDDRSRWTGPEHASCNRAAAGSGNSDRHSRKW